MSTPVPGGSPDAEGFVYDEMSYFAENCAEYALALPAALPVERVTCSLPDGRSLSGLRWGQGEPRVVLVHGGAQNAHTWDTVALALSPVALLAVDLPGHGHSDWRIDGDYGPRQNADDLAVMIGALAPNAELVVGMSLGGLTVTALAARHPDLVQRLALVDITPGVTRDKAADVHAFIEGPQTFETFADIFDRTVEFNPTRSAESLRRGILHNAHRRTDGSWQWNYDRGLAGAVDAPTDPPAPTAPTDPTILSGPADPTAPGGSETPEDRVLADGADLWADVSAVGVPLTLVRGGASPVVDDDDVAEFLRRQPDAEVLVVDGAGHSIQGDRPLELATIIAERLGPAG